MAGLGTTVARLLRQQTNWQQGFSDSFSGPPQPALRGDGLLEEITSGGSKPGHLRQLRYVPRNLQTDLPLVVVLHGCTQQGAAYADGAGWIELADRFGFCLLLPEQRRANNPNLCFNWFLPDDTTRDHGEVLSIRQMIAQTSAECGIDPARVFVTGLSAGGAMTSAMLATYPEVFAGGAIIAGLPYHAATDIPSAFKVMGKARELPATQWRDVVRSASHHSGPWPKVSIWHGGGDNTVDSANARETAKQWTAVHGLPEKADATEKGPRYVRRVWNGGTGEPVVEEFTIAGLGHGTPLATGTGSEHFGAPAPFLLEAGISSSHRIATFWGIAQSEIRAAAPRAAASAVDVHRTPEPMQNTPPLQRFPSHPQLKNVKDIGGVINKALRSAGLIK